MPRKSSRKVLFYEIDLKGETKGTSSQASIVIMREYLI